MDLEEEIDRLYGLPLDEFVNKRDALARRLTRGGDREGGARIKSLRKPTVGAWALNQAVRRRRAETDALLKTGERLRQAHEALLTGGDQAPLRETMDEERSLTGALADCAEAIASETGKSGPALRDRVRATLHAAAVDDEAREELAAGRFVREREAVGLGPFGAGAPLSDAPSAPKRGRAKRATAKQDPTVTPSRGKRDRATAERPRGERAAAERAGGKRSRAGGARGKPAGGARAKPAPDPRLAEAERSVAEGREALERAEAEHEAAIASLNSAREALDDADVAERETRRLARELEREVAKQERRLERLRPKR
jgi:hypothetical protein